MKAFFILALCVAGTLGGLTEEQKANLQNHQELCLAESGAEPAVVAEVIKGLKKLPENDEKFACFTSCLLKKIGILDDEGKIQENVLRAKLPADLPQGKADELVNGCKGLAGETSCQGAQKIFKCYTDANILKFL